MPIPKEGMLVLGAVVIVVSLIAYAVTSVVSYGI